MDEDQTCRRTQALLESRMAELLRQRDRAITAIDTLTADLIHLSETTELATLALAVGALGHVKRLLQGEDAR